MVLCFTWFLQAGWGWASEGIASIAHYFHLLAWGTAGALVIVVIVSQSLDGDVFSGICSVGNWDAEALYHFLLLPLGISLGLGLLFLLLGFANMLKYRSFIKADVEQEARIERLEKLMLRISAFSAAYVVPAVMTAACLLYQAKTLPYWLRRWYDGHCAVSSASARFGFPTVCPEPAHPPPPPPEFLVFLIKYIMSLVLGITCAVWICSAKTVHSWNAFYNRVFRRRQRVPTQEPPTAQAQNSLL